MVAEVASHYLLKPPTLLGAGLMSASLRFAFKLVQLGRHPLLYRPSLHLKSSFPAGPANLRKPKEVECLRRSPSGLTSVVDRKAAKLDQSRFAGMQFQRKLLQSFPQLSQKPIRVGAILEFYNEVINVARDDYLTPSCSLFPSPELFALSIVGPTGPERGAGKC